MGMKNLPLISKHLIDAGMKPDTPAALVYRGTTPFQRTLVSTIGELPERAVQEPFYQSLGHRRGRRVPPA